MFVLRQIQILVFSILFLHIFPMFVIVCVLLPHLPYCAKRIIELLRLAVEKPLTHWQVHQIVSSSKVLGSPSVKST